MDIVTLNRKEYWSTVVVQDLTTKWSVFPLKNDYCMCTDLACVWFFKQCSAYCYCVEVEVVVSGDKKIHSHHSAVVGGWRKFSHSVYELTKIIKDTCTSPEIITPYNLIRVCRANAPEKICNNRNKQVIVAEVSTAVHYHRSSPNTQAKLYFIWPKPSL